MADDVSTEMAEFLNYLKSGKGDSPLVNKIEEQVRKARAHEEWKVEYMTLQMRLNEEREEGREEGRIEGREEGREEGKREMVLRCLAKGYPLEMIADISGMTIEEIRRIEEERRK